MGFWSVPTPASLFYFQGRRKGWTMKTVESIDKELSVMRDKIRDLEAQRVQAGETLQAAREERSRSAYLASTGDDKAHQSLQKARENRPKPLWSWRTLTAPLRPPARNTSISRSSVKKPTAMKNGERQWSDSLLIGNRRLG